MFSLCLPLEPSEGTWRVSGRDDNSGWRRETDGKRDGWNREQDRGWGRDRVPDRVPDRVRGGDNRAWGRAGYDHARGPTRDRDMDGLQDGGECEHIYFLSCALFS